MNVTTGKQIDWNRSEFDVICTLSKVKFNPIKEEKIYPCIELEHIEKETGRLLGNIHSDLQLSIKNVFRNGDVLFGKLRPNLRKYYYCNFDGVCSSEIWVLKPKSNVSGKFLFYLVQQERFIKSACVTTGSKMPRADWNYISQIPFNYPPLPEQKAIADLLSTWDEAIDKMERLVKAKERRLEGFGRKLFNTSNHGRKKGWELAKLSDVLIEHGNSSTGNEEVYSVSVHKGLVNQIEHLGRSFSAANTDHYNRVQYGDLVYTKSPTGDFPYGIVKQSLEREDVIVSPLYGVFRPLSFDLGTILDFYFTSPLRARNYLFPIIQKGAKNTIAITNKTFLSKLLNLPVDKEIQKELASFISTAREEIRILNKLRDRYQAQKRGLMQKLLTGQWRVNPEVVERYGEEVNE